MRAKLLKLSGPVLVLGTAVGVVMLLKATAPEPQTEEAPPRPVTVYTHLAETSDAILDVQTQGEVRARTMINLTAQVGGRIVSVSPEYVEGGRFDSSTVLMKIDDSDYRVALREAQAAVAAAELSVQQALADADVARKQLRDVPNASSLSLKKPQIAEAEARREAALAALELAQLNLERTNIRLPFEGRVARTSVHIGEVISMGTTLAEVFSTDRVQIRLPLNNRQLAALGLPIGYAAEAGTAPTVDFSAQVAGKTQHWTGELVRIDAAVDPSTRLIYATAEVKDPYGLGRSEDGMPMAVGLFVEAQVTGRRLENTVRIPSKGLRPGNQLFVVDSSGLLDIRTAEVAHTSAEHAVISSGLRPGERLIVSALRNPISGMALSTIDERQFAARED
ncbi:efflux RND transporter periplasmic adaptor subunit [Congregibacter brevis]|uniref:Efflux RND transporter periplasmic adaptor subunit n=1 Tax=Congregibacter brevis TaxID=3081201 RepID=A0ABZ0IB68_9GAMM|nr:efflux RND transporter periplasmic adaptor subunit [Congregibacter sp. IMCC45268]